MEKKPMGWFKKSLISTVAVIIAFLITSLLGSWGLLILAVLIFSLVYKYLTNKTLRDRNI